MSNYDDDELECKIPPLALIAREIVDHILIFLQQIILLFVKNFRQKWVNGRNSLKTTLLIPIGVVGFTSLVLFLLQQKQVANSVYSVQVLPPLSSEGNGIFNTSFGGGGVFTKNLYYSPNNHTGVNNLMNALVAEYPEVVLTGFQTQAEVISEYTTHIFQVWCVVSFSLTQEQYATNSFVDITDPQSVVSYSIRMNPNIVPMPFSFYDPTVLNDYAARADGWLRSGYLTLQNFIRTGVTNSVPGLTTTPFEVEALFQRYPSSPVYPDFFSIDYRFVRYFIWKWLAPVIYTIVILMPMLSFLNEVVKEKEYRIKDLLEISGLMPISYWFGYLVTILTFLLIPIWITLGFLYGVGVLTIDHLGPYSSLLYVFVLSLSAAGMAFSFVVFKSDYYSLPTFLVAVGTAAGGLFVAQNTTFTAAQKLAFAFFLPPTGFTMGVFIIEDWFWSYGGPMDVNFAFGSPRNLPSLYQLENVMVGSAIFYMVLCYGMPFDWIFKNDTSATQNLISTEDLDYPCDREELPGDGNRAILLDVKNLSHVYPDGTHAVKNISFHVREGEILSFLGANGAGKSTTMNMLCGTLKATVGDAIVGRFSITRSTTKARRSLGICTQQDVLWPDLSVKEHLLLFGFLRGTSIFVLFRKVAKMIEDLGFPEKANFQSSQLSGGQKRRLCAGISMIGENKVVFLDEPTAGLDPVARRQLWELVEKNREGRAILLTTHFMDEADVLGDRIAVVKEGRLRCLGSATFLKSTFGVGYLLRCSLQASANHDNCFAEIKTFVEDAALVSKAGTELSVRISKDHVSQFPVLFEHLETTGRSTGFSSFGIETTTLEEVFMRIVNEDSVDAAVNHDRSNKLLGASPEERDAYELQVRKRDDQRNPLSQDTIDLALTRGSSPSDICDCLSVFTQVRVMYRKRFRQFTRSKGQLALGLFTPMGFICLITYLLYQMPTTLLGPSPAPIQLPYMTPFSYTIVAGPSEISAMAWANDAFNFDTSVPAVPFDYVSSNYNGMYSFVDYVASNEVGVNSSEAIAFGTSMNNYTIMYNASYPINFAASASLLLEAGVNSASQGKLSFDEFCQYLPYTSFGEQVNTCYFGAILFGVLGGAMGAALSIVVSGERVLGVKHQQLASGASTLAYWLANYFYDFTNFLLITVLFTIALAIAKPSTWGGANFSAAFVGGIFYSFAAPWRFYCLSYFIRDIKMAQTYFFYGSVALMYVVITIWGNVIFGSGGGNGNILSQLAIQVTLFVTILEPAFGYFLLVVGQNNFFGMLTLSGSTNVLSVPLGGTILLGMVVVFIIYATILAYIELGGLAALLLAILKLLFFPLFCITGYLDSAVKFLSRNEDFEAMATFEFGVEPEDSLILGNPRFRIPGEIDPDVQNEISKVKEIYESRKLSAKAHAIFIYQLKKVYFARGTTPTKIAVKNMSLTIPHGEIFGLLGANGAGKTTLLKMISGLEEPTEGIALINRFNIVTNRSSAQRSMGLCPQFDTLVERLTVRENLLLFARIKGISRFMAPRVCDAFMVAMSIKKYEHKLIQQLSGGNRRKVSLVVALLGGPPTVYLDEPSTGLDPVASRLMWRLLKIVGGRKEHAVVLTTHNMLECEAVCTRIGIMRNGEMTCMGNSQHLRSAYGTGFLLEMTLSDASYINDAKQFVAQAFANAFIVDEHVNMLNYEFPVSSVSKLSAAFRIMEDAKEKLHIVDYSLSQSTLEQVFLKQIRPVEGEVEIDENSIEFTKPHFGDYLIAYIALLFALLIPGLHHFILRNNWRGALYFFTFNEVFCGWFLDLFDMRVLVQRSVQEYGHINVAKCCCFAGCGCCCGACLSCLGKCCYASFYYMCCCCCPCYGPADKKKCCPPPGQQRSLENSNLITSQPSPRRNQDIELGAASF